MEEELVELISLYDRCPEVFSINPKEDGTKVERLFFLVRANPEQTKKFFKNKLYGESYRGTGYSVLKGELRKKLVTDARRIDFRSLSKSQYLGESLELFGDFHVLRCLHALGYRKISGFLGKEILDKVEKRKTLPDIKYNTSRFLAQGSVNSSKKKMLQYTRLADEAVQDLVLHNQVFAMRQKWQSMAMDTLNPSRDLKDTIDIDLKYIKALGNGSQNMEVKMGISSLESFRHQVFGDFLKMIKVNESLLSNLQNSSMEFDGYIGLVYRRLALGYMNLKNYQLACRYTLLTLGVNSPGGYNWFTSNEAYVLVLFRMKEIKRIESVIQEVTSNKSFRFLIVHRRTAWLIYRGYLDFLYESGIYNNYVGVSSGKNDLTDFKRNFLGTKGDKSGSHLNELILQCLFHICRGNYLELIDLNGSLKRYSTRYANDDLQKRSRQFLTFITKVVDADFIFSEVQSRTKKIRIALGAEESKFNNESYATEIIDYEVLWDWVLNKIKENSYARPLN